MRSVARTSIIPSGTPRNSRTLRGLPQWFMGETSWALSRMEKLRIFQTQSSGLGPRRTEQTRCIVDSLYIFAWEITHFSDSKYHVVNFIFTDCNVDRDIQYR